MFPTPPEGGIAMPTNTPVGRADFANDTGVFSSAPAATGTVISGAMVTVKPMSAILAEEKAAAELANADTTLTSLASHIRKRFQTMRDARAQTAEPRMLQGLRQRRGEYDPDTMARIRAQGGTEVYMRLSANKARAAASWIRDTLSATDGPLPYTIEPTPSPDLPKARLELEYMKFLDELQQAAAAGVNPPPWDLDALIRAREGVITNSIREESASLCAKMKRKMDDQLVEGGIANEFHKFIDDLVTFPFAVIKGPVVERRKTLQWVEGAETPSVEVTDELAPVWKRVSPFDIYWMQHMAYPDEGDLIERHRLTRTALSDLIGAPGYSDEAIRAVLDEYGRAGYREPQTLDSERAAAEGKDTTDTWTNPAGLIEALQYWGSAQGKLLLEWGLTEEDVPDPLAEYQIEAWLVGKWVIKALLNPDPLNRKPYYKTSYGEIPGSWCGESPMDLVRDCQDVCNGAIRALVNNMGIASGPQVYVMVDRLMAGEDITQLYPWKIHQFRADYTGNTSPPIGFFQPNSLATELLNVYENISVKADEYSGIPRYMTGDGAAGGAGRTATGMSMMMSNAGKTIQQVIANIDRHIIAPLVERLWYWNMLYLDDASLKGDIHINARGANSLVIKDAAAVRRNELLQLALQSPVVQQIIGMEGIAYMLREQAEALSMNADKIVPPPEVMKAKALVAQAQQLAMQAAQAQQGVPPGGPMPPEGQPMPPPGGPMQPGGPPGEVLMDGATPVADNFGPQPSPQGAMPPRPPLPQMPPLG